jgi:hypothetical protein
MLFMRADRRLVMPMQKQNCLFSTKDHAILEVML